MNFTDNPRLYINDYYEDKINQIDLNCEHAILENGEDSEKENTDLNIIRMNSIEKLKSVKQNVLLRFDIFESNNNIKINEANSIKIRDDVFLDQYCFVLDIYQWFSMFEFKTGVLLFSQYEDSVLQDLR